MILEKKSNLWVRSNLTKHERRVLKELERDDKLRVHEFDKGCGSQFQLMIRLNKKQKNNQAKQQKKKQTQEIDSRTRFRKTLQTQEGNPSDPIPPHLYDTIKAHKPE